MSYLARLVAHLSLERGHLDTDAFSYRLTQRFILNKMPCSKMFHVEHFEAWHFAVRKLLFFAVRFQIRCDLSSRSWHVAAVDVEHGREVGVGGGIAQDAGAFARAGAAVGDDGKDALA